MIVLTMNLWKRLKTFYANLADRLSRRSGDLYRLGYVVACNMQCKSAVPSYIQSDYSIFYIPRIVQSILTLGRLIELITYGKIMMSKIEI